MSETGTSLRHIALATLGLLFCLTNSFASQVILKNGDRITGVVTVADKESLTISSTLIGEVRIPWSAVERASIEEKAEVPAQVRLEGRRKVHPSPSPDAAKVGASNFSGAQTPRTSDFLRHWSGSFNPGFALTQGNTNNRTLNLVVNAVRTTAQDKIALSTNWVYTHAQAGGKSFTAAKAARSGVRYDVNMSESLFVFGSGDWESDRNQRLDLRNVLGGGFGWHSVRHEKFRVDLTFGHNYNREYFSNRQRWMFAEAVFGQEADYRPNEHFTTKSRLMIVPNLSETGHYRAISETTAVTSLNKYLGWQVTLTDRYTSFHLPGVKPNDLLLTTGIRVAFSR
jgi:putative salt-induced outer membrane protein YdiY